MRLYINYFCLTATLFSALTLAACHGGKANPPDGLSNDVQGSFIDPQAVNTQTTSIYSSCPTTAGQIDSRLQVGMSFQTYYESVNGNRPKRTLLLNAVVQTVSSDALTETLTTVRSTGLQSVAVSGSQSLTCTATGTASGCQVPSFITMMDASQSGQYSNCTVTPEGSQTVTPQVYSGKYQLASGKQVSAYKTEYTVKGTLSCDGQNLGDGSEDNVTVVSMDVPDEGSVSSCGGTKLLVLSAFKNTDGKVVYGSFQERQITP